MRQELYKNIKARMPETIKYFGLYNELKLAGAEDAAYSLPAVLIEFDPIYWKQMSQGVKSTTLQIRLHILTDNYNQAASGEEGEMKALEIFDIVDSVVLSVVSSAGNTYNRLMHIESITDHSFDAIADNIETFKCEMTDNRKALQKEYTTQPITPIIKSTIK